MPRQVNLQMTSARDGSVLAKKINEKDKTEQDRKCFLEWVGLYFTNYAKDIFCFVAMDHY